MEKVIITIICLRPYLSAMTAPGIRTNPSTMALAEPIKPMTSGGAPSSVKNGDSNEEVMEKVKNTKSQLTMRVSRFPRMKENSALILVRRLNNLNNLRRFLETVRDRDIFTSPKVPGSSHPVPPIFVHRCSNSMVAPRLLDHLKPAVDACGRV